MKIAKKMRFFRFLIHYHFEMSEKGILSFWLDTPTGVAIVCTFGILLPITAIVRKI